MAVKWTMVSNIPVVLQKLEANITAANERFVETLQESVQDKMLYGYHTPHGADGHTEIVETGALFDSITAEAQKQSQNLYGVSVGVPQGTKPASYAQYVHDGTYKLEGRPFITDGAMDSVEKLQEIYEEYLPAGFQK